MSTPVSDPNMQPISSSTTYSGSNDHDRHVVQLYTDDRFLTDVVSRFIGGALAVGDGAVVIATASHRNELAKRLSERGLDTAKASAQGRYVTLDAKETLQELMSKGEVEEARFKHIIGEILSKVRKTGSRKDSRVAVFGEMVALLWAEGKPQEAIRLEQLWNDLAKTSSFALLCAYPLAGFSDTRHIEPFLKMCEEHSGVVPSEGYLALGNDEDRMGSIARLEQKTHALERELALRESEAKFRLLVEAVRDYAIFMLDPEGYVTSWNLGAERIKGFKLPVRLTA